MPLGARASSSQVGFFTVCFHYLLPVASLSLLLMEQNKGFAVAASFCTKLV